MMYYSFNATRTRMDPPSGGAMVTTAPTTYDERDATNEGSPITEAHPPPSALMFETEERGGATNSYPRGFSWHITAC